MPVFLEHVKAPSEQDLGDLQKIFDDYPTPLRWPSLQQNVANNPAMAVYAGRFNSRLLGACTVREENNALIIEHLCVRKVTRGRNVARDIIRIILRDLPAREYRVPVCMEDAGIDKLLSNAGFTRQGDVYIRQA